jgi:hypothetical protein
MRDLPSRNIMWITRRPSDADRCFVVAIKWFKLDLGNDVLEGATTWPNAIERHVGSLCGCPPRWYSL